MLKLSILLTFAVQSFCSADVTKLSTEDRKTLLDSSRFHEIRSATNLPSPIVIICAGDGKLANPGEKWNATDAIIDPSLPGKRLIWAAVGGDCYIVHYERGGIAHSYHILVATLEKDEAKPKAVWRAIGGPFKNYGAFVDALRNGRLDDRVDYAH